MDNRKWTSLEFLIMTTSLIVLVSFSFILVCLRIHALTLEGELGNIERGIDRYTLEENELKQTVVKLTSFAEIYHYCKETLGMDNVRQVEKIHVMPSRAAVALSPEPTRGWRSNLFSFLGFTVN